jgi:hypothetical protein
LLGVLLAALAASSLAGCIDDPTEVVVVVDTDAQPFKDFAQISFTFDGGQFPSAFANADALPATIGVTPSNGRTEFNVLVSLSVTPNFFMGGPNSPPPFAARKASRIHFVDGEMRVLFLPIFKDCACLDSAGQPITSCAAALEPECHDMVSPALGDFDSDSIPHLPPTASATP